MFRALRAHHQEVKIVYTASVVITPIGGCPVHRLKEDSSLTQILFYSIPHTYLHT